MSRRILVTGAAGFLGRHLSAALLARGDEVVGMARPGSTRERPLLPMSWVEADLLVPSAVKEALEEAAPHFVYHLAVRMGGSPLEELLANNVVGTSNLLEALVTSRHQVQGIVAVGSAAEYGPIQEAELPVTERQPLRPLSFYGVSKAAQSLLVQQYHLRHALPLVRVRCFNLWGPGEPPSQVAGAFAEQIAQIEGGLKDAQLAVGNLLGVRDFLDVRDAARGLIELCEKGKVGGVYNLCSGRPRSIHSILAALLVRSTQPIAVVQDPARVAPKEVDRIFGDPGAVQRDSGWRPEVPFGTTADDLLQYWRERVAKHLPAGELNVQGRVAVPVRRPS